MPTPLSEQEERLTKLAKIRAAGIDPYPALAERDVLIADLRSAFEKYQKAQQAIKVVGRLRSIREHGNLTFADLQDGSGKIQIVFNKKTLGPQDYKTWINVLDVGDFIQAQGQPFVTRAGEPSLELTTIRLLTKSLAPLPDQFYGFKNPEERLRKRYLDLLMHDDVREMFAKKAKFWKTVRHFMVENGFLEVETPVLETTTGGADARPFKTHHHALDIDVYLRISTGELWQKRLMVAGFEKTFEIGRQFRNEGMDAEHLQDYSQMEFYWAYADYRSGMAFVERLYKHVAQETFGTLKFAINGFDIDFGKPWEEIDFCTIIKEKTGIDPLTADLKSMETALQRLRVEYDHKGFNRARALDNLWKFCRKDIAGPAFLIGTPVALSPLAKRVPEHPELVQRFQPIIAGSELGNGYSELNDPLDQELRFQEQGKLREKGDEEAHMNDEDFVEALKVGMPPTCGFGMSERVFSFLMNKSLRECQLFPLVRPKDKQSKKENEDK